MNNNFREKLIKQGKDFIERNGYPTKRDEDFRYSDVSFLTDKSFSLDEKENFILTLEDVPSCFAPNTIRIVFENGFYRSDFSDLSLLTSDIQVENLSGNFNFDIIHKSGLGFPATGGETQSRPFENVFTALNDKFFTDGIVIRIAKKCEVKPQIHIIYLTSDSSENNTKQSHYKNYIVLEENAKAIIIEKHMGKASHFYYKNNVTNIVLGQNASLEHYKIQNENVSAYHTANIFVNQKKDSDYTSHNITLGALYARNQIDTFLEEENSTSKLYGVYTLNKSRRLENYTNIEHIAENAQSIEKYHGILDDSAKAVFRGKILVHRDAQKTDSQQSSKTILLSEDAKSVSMPQLEIYADDVKCAHGSTTGQISKESLYYMRSRGISIVDAKKLLIEAFIREITENFTLEKPREKITGMLLNRLN